MLFGSSGFVHLETEDWVSYFLRWVDEFEPRCPGVHMSECVFHCVQPSGSCQLT